MLILKHLSSTSDTVATDLKSPLRQPGFKSYAVVSSHLALMNEYLATDSGGYLCTSSLWALITAWLGASQKGQDSV